MSYALGRRGLYYAKKGDLKKAEMDFEQSLKRNPRNVQTYLIRGETYLNNNDLEKGLELSKKSVDIKRTHYELYTLSAAYSENKNIPKAIEILNEAISLLKDGEYIKDYRELLEFYESGKTHNDYLESNKKREKVEE
jgi:tetratricopeptide (TPR) repeat protein